MAIEYPKRLGVESEKRILDKLCNPCVTNVFTIEDFTTNAGIFDLISRITPVELAVTRIDEFLEFIAVNVDPLDMYNAHLSGSYIYKLCLVEKPEVLLLNQRICKHTHLGMPLSLIDTYKNKRILTGTAISNYIAAYSNDEAHLINRYLPGFISYFKDSILNGLVSQDLSVPRSKMEELLKQIDISSLDTDQLACVTTNIVRSLKNINQYNESRVFDITELVSRIESYEPRIKENPYWKPTIDTLNKLTLLETISLNTTSLSKQWFRLANTYDFNESSLSDISI